MNECDEWIYFKVPEDNEIYPLLQNRCYRTFALFGPKWKKEYENYPTLPFVHDLPVQTEERFSLNNFKYKYKSHFMRDVLENIECYDTSEEFAKFYDCMNHIFAGTIYIDEALDFDYDEVVIDGMSWRNMICDNWFKIIDYFKHSGLERAHIVFSF